MSDLKLIFEGLPENNLAEIKKDTELYKILNEIFKEIKKKDKNVKPLLNVKLVDNNNDNKKNQIYHHLQAL